MIYRVAALLFMISGLAGCVVVQEKTFGESLDDTSAVSQIRAQLLAKSPSRFHQVGVEVTSRLVLLTGRVETEEDKVEADQVAWSVRTIDEVANEIVVMPKAGILSNVNDDWISAKLRSRLLGDADIKSVNYNIKTYNNVVYLLGFARDQTELKRAAEHASLIKGVDRVVSYVKMRDRSSPNSGNGSQEELFGPSTIQQGSIPQAAQPKYRDQNQYPTNGQVGFVDPSPPQNLSGYDDSGLLGGRGQQSQPFVDPLQPTAQYDKDGYLIVPDEGKSGSSGYSDPYADPFGDGASSK